jgi:TusA-related sulfurtransferase
VGDSSGRVDAEWDAGDTGCGELVLALRVRLDTLRPGQIMKLTARDPGAPTDIPAWCQQVLRQPPLRQGQPRQAHRGIRQRQCGRRVRQGDSGPLSIEAVRLAQKGYADDIREEGFAPLKELMESFAKADGAILICSPCFKKRRLDESSLVPGAAIGGGAKLVEFLSDGSPCVSY